MCGIAGIINFDGTSPSRAVIRKMTDALRHRGPDGEGYYFHGKTGEYFSHDLSGNIPSDANIALSHRRLSIIDISEGTQPMSTPDKSLWIVFNGEIYNYVELKQELKNCEFRTHSDTEVILNAYKTWGIDCLKKLNGMFAFALYDKNNDKIIFARDRLGKKPLFYYRDAKQFVFSSELPSLLQALEVGESDIDLTMIPYFLQYQYLPSPKTIFKNIDKLEQGYFAELNLKNCEFRKKAYWELNPQIDKKISFGDAKDKLKEILYDAVKIRLRSDVPYSAFLSGGIDSSMICKIVSELAGNKFTAYTIGYKDSSFDESLFAKETAEKLGIKHNFEIISPSFFENVASIATQFGEPFADSSALPTFAVSKIASKDYKVAITGDGGDELFAGYNSYDTIRSGMDAYPPPHLKGIRIPEKIRRIIGKSGFFPGETNYKKLHRQTMTIWSADNLREILLPEFLPKTEESFDRYMAKPADWLTDCQFCDLTTYLHNDILVKTDRMSMMNSLELRSPILDYRIVEFAFSLPPEFKYAKIAGKWDKKRILKSLAAEFLGEKAVSRPKQGFGFPLYDFFRGRQKLFESLLDDDIGITKQFFRTDSISKMLKNKNDMGDATRLWYIYCFVSWFKTAIQNKTV
jgi:asparagine synthase (glutamine-hydrolysing)